MDLSVDGSLEQLLSAERIDDERFVSRENQANVNGEIYGGQYLGQAVAAATACTGRPPHAMTGFFLRAAVAAHSVDIKVERVREGRHFSHCRVLMSQSEKLVFCADISMHELEPSQPSHYLAAPSVPPPEQLSSIADLVECVAPHRGVDGSEPIGIKRDIDLRPVEQVVGITTQADEPRFSCWARLRNFDSGKPMLSYAALAYLSDYWLSTSSRITHQRSLFSGEATALSLNHGMWFHRPPDLSDWILHATDGPSTNGGVGLNRGLMYAREGQLLASTVQEALIRVTAE